MISFSSPSKRVRNLEIYIPNPFEVIKYDEIVFVAGNIYVAYCKKRKKIFMNNRVRNAHYLLGSDGNWIKNVFSALKKLKLITQGDLDLHLKANDLYLKIQKLSLYKKEYIYHSNCLSIDPDERIIKKIDCDVDSLQKEYLMLREED